MGLAVVADRELAERMLEAGENRLRIVELPNGYYMVLGSGVVEIKPRKNTAGEYRRLARIASRLPAYMRSGTARYWLGKDKTIVIELADSIA